MYIKHYTKICRWYLLVAILKIDIKYTFLVKFHIFSRNDRLFIDQCDVIARANMENCYQNSRWGKERSYKIKKQRKLYVSFKICLFFRPISALIIPTPLLIQSRLVNKHGHHIQAIIVSDQSISKISSPLKLSSQMNRSQQEAPMEGSVLSFLKAE